ncbi:MAG: sugar ABC transporter permease [Devosia sp.]
MTDITAQRAEGQPDPSFAVMRAAAMRRKRLTLLPSVIATLPLSVVAIGVFIIGIGFTVVWSFTSTKFFPTFDFVGLKQYSKLWSTPRWIVSVSHIWFYGLMQIGGSMIFGFVLAVFMDQRIRQEDTFRTIFLYPFALSLVITGLVWQWVMDPNLGLEAAVQRMGWTSFHFAPISDQRTAIYGMVLANIWNSAGVTMAILLAGLRGIDEEIWKATRVDGIPAGRAYIFIVLPMMRGAVATALILLTVGVVRIFDLEVALTGGGPGTATRMPASYVIDNINSRDVGQGMAAATMMLIPVVAVLAFIALWRWAAARRAERLEN